MSCFLELLTLQCSSEYILDYVWKHHTPQYLRDMLRIPVVVVASDNTEQKTGKSRGRYFLQWLLSSQPNQLCLCRSPAPDDAVEREVPPRHLEVGSCDGVGQLQRLSINGCRGRCSFSVMLSLRCIHAYIVCIIPITGTQEVTPIAQCPLLAHREDGMVVDHVPTAISQFPSYC